MGEIEWAMWANEQAIISCIVTWIGAVIGVAAMFSNWQFAAFAIPASLLVLLFEYPRSSRKKGTTHERRFQQILTPMIEKMGLIGRNYFVRFILYLAVSIPCCFLLPTILGGMCLQLTAIIYLVAAIKGEEWKPVKRKEEKTGGQAIATSQPPSRPPPRAPHREETSDNQGAVHNRV